MVTNFFGHQVQAWRRREPLATDLRLAAAAGLGLVGAARRASGLAGLQKMLATVFPALSAAVSSRRRLRWRPSGSASALAAGE